MFSVVSLGVLSIGLMDRQVMLVFVFIPCSSPLRGRFHRADFRVLFMTCEPLTAKRKRGDGRAGAEAPACFMVDSCFTSFESLLSQQ